MPWGYNAGYIVYTVLAEVFQTNCSFSVGQHPTGGVRFLFLGNVLLVLGTRL